MSQSSRRRVSGPEKGNGNVLDLLRKYSAGRKCNICSQIIQYSQYKSHINGCKLPSDDSDIEITEVLDAEEKSRRAGEKAVLVDLVESDENEEPQPSTSQTTVLKRSAKIIVNDEEVIVEEVSTQIAQKRRSNEESSGAKRRRPGRLNASNDDTSNESNVKTIDLKDAADRIKAKCEDLLSIAPIRLSLEGGEESISNDSVSLRHGLHYTIKFTLRMIARILEPPAEAAFRYDEHFWGEDILFFEKFTGLRPTAQRLLTRLLMRKRTWFTIDALIQKSPQNSFRDDLLTLVKEGFVETHSNLKGLDEALRLCSADKIQEIAKKFQVDHAKGKLDIIKELTNRSKTQRSIFGTTNSLANRMLSVTKQVLGPAYRLDEQADRIFKALFTLYAPLHMNSSLVYDAPATNLSQALMHELLKLESNKIMTPAPNPPTSLLSIYQTKRDLLHYIAAKDLEISLITLLSNAKYAEAHEKSNLAREQLDAVTDQEFVALAQMPTYLRRFTKSWVHVRCVACGAAQLERLKRYDEAVVVYRYLLHSKNLELFCVNERGLWWERLTLCLHSHLKSKDEAFEECTKGLQDSLIGDKDRVSLQDRLSRIGKPFQVVVTLCEPTRKDISAQVLTKDAGNGRTNQFIQKNENGDVCIVSVEKVALAHYIKEEGFTAGTHAEGAIWHNVLGLLFYDIINEAELNKACWISELQNAPLDLNLREFYTSRAAKFDERLLWLQNAPNDDILECVFEALEAYKLIFADDLLGLDAISEVDFVNFVRSCNGRLLAAVCARIIKDRRNTRSGFPDLTIWNAENCTIAVVEVKGPGDKLSTKQRLWLDFFAKEGIRAEVCHVAAVRDKFY